MSNKTHDIGPPFKLAYRFSEAADEASLFPSELTTLLRSGEIESRKIHGRVIVSGRSLRDYVQRIFDGGRRYG